MWALSDIMNEKIPPPPFPHDILTKIDIFCNRISFILYNVPHKM